MFSEIDQRIHQRTAPQTWYIVCPNIRDERRAKIAEETLKVNSRKTKKVAISLNSRVWQREASIHPDHARVIT